MTRLAGPARRGDGPERVDVAVVGAGPVGLMLAGELRLGGAAVLVLERLDEPTGESRASQLSARTVELLHQRGLMDALGPPRREEVGHFGGLPLDVGRTGSPLAGHWKVPQPRTEEVLTAWAVGLGAEVRRGHEVVGMHDTGAFVGLDVAGPDGIARLNARYVVGCDGGDSTVRRAAGIAFPGRDARREMLLADVTGVDVAPRRFQRREHGVAVAATAPDGVTRVMVHEYGRPPGRRSADPAFDEVVGAWERVTGEDLSSGRCRWTAAFDDACHHAARYRLGRVLLAGDAARRHMPVGGQALNTGLYDAVNLGWKLAACVRGRAPDELLDTYGTERRAAGARVVDNVETQTILLFDGPQADPARDLFGELLMIPVAADRLAAMVSGLDPLPPAGADAERDPFVGRWLPPCRTADDGTLVPVQPPGAGALLVGSRGSDRRTGAGTAAAPWADRVHRVSSRDSDGLLPAGATAALVRPDGHVAWTDTACDSVTDALLRWFGRPLSSSDPAPHTSREGHQK